MKIVIDTNSLLSLVRYYLPFDSENHLIDFFQIKIANGNIIIIDKVYQQCQYQSKGLILEKLDFLTMKDFLKKSKQPFKTSDLLIPNPKRFFHLLDNNFVNSIVKKQKKITDAEFEVEKERFLEDADMKLVIVSLNFIQKGEDVLLITEETSSNNDNKLFNKIPLICSELNIVTKTLPELIGMFSDEIKFSIVK